MAFIQYEVSTGTVTGYQSFPLDKCALFAGVSDESGKEYATAEIQPEQLAQVVASMDAGQAITYGAGALS